MNTAIVRNRFPVLAIAALAARHDRELRPHLLPEVPVRPAAAHARGAPAWAHRHDVARIALHAGAAHRRAPRRVAQAARNLHGLPGRRARHPRVSLCDCRRRRGACTAGAQSPAVPVRAHGHDHDVLAVPRERAGVAKEARVAQTTDVPRQPVAHPARGRPPGLADHGAARTATRGARFLADIRIRRVGVDRTTGANYTRIHPAYVYGGIALLVSVPARRALGFTDAWIPIAQWLTG